MVRLYLVESTGNCAVWWHNFTCHAERGMLSWTITRDILVPYNATFTVLGSQSYVEFLDELRMAEFVLKWG